MEKINQHTDGIRRGYWKKYKNNGELHYVGNYDDNGYKTGYWERYFTNTNKLWYCGSYRNGNRIGYREEYNYDGSLYSISFYI